MSNKPKATALKPDDKPALLPKLRFPEFRNAAGWEIGKVDELVDTVTPPKKLPTSNYASKGAFPIIDQSQSDICGWTDDHEALIQEGLPLIVFGDHTCILKLIDHPFAQGADGIKILKSRRKVEISYLYQFLSYRPVVTEEYKRHYSILKEKTVAFPDPKTGEQKKIAECLSSVDDLMAAQARKLVALKTHKKALMQQLFPCEGETQPSLRFPEFKNAEDWAESQLNGLSSVGLSNGVFNDPKKVGSGYKLINVLDMYLETTIIEERLSMLELSDSEFEKNRVKHGDIFFTRSSLVKSGIAVSNIYLGSSKDVTFDGHLIRFRSNTEKVVPLFAHYLFKTEPVRAQLIARGKSATMTTIGQVDVGGVMLLSPPKEEQQRIANCLITLDDLIVAQTQKLDALKTHKRGLMQQLFPSQEEVEA